MRKLTLLTLLSCLLSVLAQAQSSTIGTNNADALSPIEDSGKEQSASKIGLRLPVQKGRVMLGMNVAPSFGFGSADNGKGLSSYYQIGATPRFGYFFTDHLAAGLLLNSSFAGNSSYRSESYGGGGFARWYFGNGLRENGTVRKARFFVEGGVTFNGGSAIFKNVDGTEDKVNFNNLTPYLMPGFNYFFTKNIAVEAGLQLNRAIYSQQGGHNMADVSDVAPVIGLHYFFDKKR